MVTNNEIKQVRQLHQKKYRVQTGRFIVEGTKLNEELLQSEFTVEKIFATADQTDFLADISFEKVSPAQMKKMSAMNTPPGLLAVVAIPEKQLPHELKGWMLALDGVSDPGNLGTILRVADWFGISGIVMSTTSVDIYNPKVVQASMGSIFRVPVYSTDLAKWIDSLPAEGRNVFVAEMNGVSFEKVAFPKQGILVMGSESHGVSAAVASLAEGRITIPGKGGAESLNVGVATGIICSRLPK